MNSSKRKNFSMCVLCAMLCVFSIAINSTEYINVDTASDTIFFDKEAKLAGVVYISKGYDPVAKIERDRYILHIDKPINVIFQGTVSNAFQNSYLHRYDVELRFTKDEASKLAGKYVTVTGVIEDNLISRFPAMTGIQMNVNSVEINNSKQFSGKAFGGISTKNHKFSYAPNLVKVVGTIRRARTNYGGGQFDNEYIYIHCDTYAWIEGYDTSYGVNFGESTDTDKTYIGPEYDIQLEDSANVPYSEVQGLVGKRAILTGYIMRLFPNVAVTGTDFMLKVNQVTLNPRP
jgi:hypothetical protein